MTPHLDPTDLLAEAQRRGAECWFTRKPVTCDNRGTEYEPLELHEWCDACFMRVMRTAYSQQTEELALARAELEEVRNAQSRRIIELGPWWSAKAEDINRHVARADAAEAEVVRLRAELKDPA